MTARAGSGDATMNNVAPTNSRLSIERVAQPPSIAPGRQRGTFSTRPYLIIVRAGAQSRHSTFIGVDCRRNYDLLVTEYEDGVPYFEGDGIVYVSLPGNKLSGFNEIFIRHVEIFERYSHIALIDDDIETSGETLSASFEYGVSLGLQVWQPSLTWDSYFSYACFLNNPGFRVRYTNFVEMMCPFFSTQALRLIAPLFGLGYRTGIDLVWCRVLKEPFLKAAILDNVVVRHTRPIGATKAQRGYARHERYDDVFLRMLDDMGLTFRGNVVYAALDRNNNFIGSRLSILVRSTRILAAIRSSPQGGASFLRPATDHLRHLLYRPINLSHFDLDAFLKRRSSQQPA